MQTQDPTRRGQRNGCVQKPRFTFGERLCVLAILCCMLACLFQFLIPAVYAAAELFSAEALTVSTEPDTSVLVTIVWIAVLADAITGLSGILFTALSWRDKTRLRRKKLLALTVIAVLLPFGLQGSLTLLTDLLM